MFKQLLIVALMVGAVACEKSHSDQEEEGETTGHYYPTEAAQGLEDSAPVRRQGFISLKNHLSDLAAQARKGATRTYTEAQPTLGQIRQDLGDSYEQIRTHPRVVGGQGWLKPRYEAAKSFAADGYKRGKEFVLPKYESFKARAVPTYAEGSKRIGSVMSRIGSKMQDVRKNAFGSKGGAGKDDGNQTESAITVQTPTAEASNEYEVAE